MKLLLSCIAAAAALVGIAQQSFAVVGNCAPDFQWSNLPVGVQCPGSGLLVDIRSVASIDRPILGQTFWKYRINMQAGPAASAQPRVGASLVTLGGAFAVASATGTKCPEAVDTTVGNGVGSDAQCVTVGSGTGFPRKVRIFHNHI